MLDLEAWNHTRTGMTEDHREAARAFVENASRSSGKVGRAAAAGEASEYKK
jgi:hypothetical protein